MKRPLAPLALAATLLSLNATEVDARGRVLSLSGQVTADTIPLEVGADLGAKKRLTLRSEATLRALLHDGLHLALAGAARVALLADGLRVDEARALEVSALSGKVLLPGGYQLVIAPPGATLRYTRGSLRVVWGRLTLKRPCPPALVPSSSPSSGPSSRPARCTQSGVLKMGDHASLGEEGGKPPPSTAAELSPYAPPSPWSPSLAITLADLESVQQWVAAKRKSQQELAACGCTEGASGDSANSTPQQGSISPIENNAATLRISIKGLPPRGTR